ncbi:MAG: hypothetical protein K0U36_04400 [Alphaproteobacteria bacterium]|nr:hypothetical protein [Alphaproteobacteria bacterium]
MEKSLCREGVTRSDAKEAAEAKAGQATKAQEAKATKEAKEAKAAKEAARAHAAKEAKAKREWCHSGVAFALFTRSPQPRVGRRHYRHRPPPLLHHDTLSHDNFDNFSR